MTPRPSIAPILEAVALAAAVRLRWPEYDSDRTRIILMPDLPEWVVSARHKERMEFLERAQADPRIAFHEEHIHLDRYWTGSQHVSLGYGRESDVLAVKLPEEIREQLAGESHG